MSQPQKESGLIKFTRILGMVMSFVYIVLGVGLFMNAIQIGLESTAAKILGGGLVAYGAFRFYRAMRGPQQGQ